MMYLCYDLSSSDLVLFFKQKTAYEMRISDWSSDVCSSDLKFGIVRAFATVAVVSDFVGCSTGAYPVDVTANRLFPRGEALTLAGVVRVSRRHPAWLRAPPRG